jgi:hypothetical protein
MANIGFKQTKDGIRYYVQLSPGELLDYFNLVIVPRDKSNPSAIGADAHSKPKRKRGEK